MRTQKELMSVTSGHYLTECFPDDWNDMIEDAQLEWIEDHLWEPFEYWDGVDVLNLIEDAAYATAGWLNEQG